MKHFSLKSHLVAATAATAVLTAGMASAQETQSNDIMMGFNPFNDSVLEPSVTAPSYMLGFKASDQLMPYVFASILDDDRFTDTIITLGGGARMYISDMSNRVRPYAGAAAGIVSADETGFGIGGFFGAEAMITDGFSISGQVGAELRDDGNNSAFELGTANVMFNLYF